MNSLLVSLLGIYAFIAVGFVAKASFKSSIDDKTITILNVYFLQVFLTFWGLLARPIDTSLVLAPSIYLLIVTTVLIFSAVVARRLFEDQKSYSIATVATIIGNTGNLGIPLCIAIFGEESIPYTTMINLANVFVVYTVGVFYYSRGSFDLKGSLLNIIKLPILWAALVAIMLNLVGYKPSKTVDDALMMGAYASITMQLILFGIYLYGTKVEELRVKLTSWVMSVKFLLLPAVTIVVLSFFSIDPLIKAIIFIELLMPLAIANVNIASLYDCHPKVVTSQVFISSLLFVGAIFVGVEIVKHLWTI
ncbi:MAG: AEC family transporter [Sulfuricurvum sp.]